MYKIPLLKKGKTLAFEIVFKLMAYDCQGVMRKRTILTVYCAKSLAGPLEMNHLGRSFQKSAIIFINEYIAFLRISDINWGDILT